jgi:DNA polymerase-3 subunit gamma/tau
MTESSPTSPALSGRIEPAADSETRSLYRKYRPQTFDADELVGQEHIVRILRNAIRLNRIAHAYLFCGPRGTGKTTTARLLAKAVNCLHLDPDHRPCNECASCIAIARGTATDVIEIDAASNRGIDDIRDLRERVKYAPVQLRTKFYIVDEAHQITGAAANAFLKTLEEPPPHTKFVLATTDPEELLPTIVSRCQRFDFRRIGFEATVSRLRTVAQAEGLAVDDDALTVIARHSTGSLRDGLSLLDQLALYVEPATDNATPASVSVDMVRGVLGVSQNDRVESLVTALADRDPAQALAVINAAVEAGEDPRQINRQLVAYLRVLMHQRAGGTVDADARARELAAKFDLARLADLARKFGEIDFAIKHSPYSHLPLEIALVEATLAPPSGGASVTPETSLERPTPTPAAHSTVPTPIRELREDDRSPSTALRDRVRGTDPGRPATARRVAETPAPVTAAPPSAPPSTEAAHADGALTVEQLADLWPRIRQDVKALNRRIEALLASVDPVRVTGDVVTLVAAYPFHRDKLNTDEVRGVVESVISRLAGHPMTVQCLLREELPAAAPTPLRAASAPPTNGASPDDTAVPATHEPAVESAADLADAVQPGDDATFDEEGFAQRVKAAQNLFDAELVEPPER